MDSKVNVDKKRIKRNKKKCVVAVILVAILIVGGILTALFVNSLRLDFDVNIKKANNDIRYIATIYNDNGEERYFFVSGDMMESFLKDIPKIDYAPSIKYVIADFFGLYSREKFEASMLVVCNVQDSDIFNKNSIGLEYDFLSYGDEIVCSFDCNHDDFGNSMINQYKVDSLEVVEYIKNFAERNTEKLTKDILLSTIKDRQKSRDSLGVEDFGKYEYKSIVSDSGHKFGLAGIAAGGKERMTIEIDETYDLYVYFSKESYINMEEDEYYLEIKTKGIILYNKKTEEYVDMMKNLDKTQAFMK